jgi:hypothetical protein
MQGGPSAARGRRARRARPGGDLLGERVLGRREGHLRAGGHLAPGVSTAFLARVPGTWARPVLQGEVVRPSRSLRCCRRAASWRGRVSIALRARLHTGAAILLKPVAMERSGARRGCRRCCTMGARAASR